MIQLLTLASVATAALIEAPLGYTSTHNGNFNTIEISIGTPGQKITLALDTGASDTWVPISDLESGLSFDPSSSSTFSQKERYFASRYADDQTVGGYWFTDTISIGSAAVPEMFMGLGIQTEMKLGNFGLGPSETSSSHESIFGQRPFKYPHFTEKLSKAQDISTVFSTWMAGEGRTGVITFGGYDKSRFEGELNTVPIVSGKLYKVQSEIVTVNGYTYPHPGIYHIDTGAEQLRVPRLLYNEIISNFAKKPHHDGTIVCDQPSPSGAMTFRFGHGHISVPLSDFMNPLLRDGQEVYNDEGQKLCIFGAVAIDSGHEFVLGGAFLRSAYIVFDWENQQVGLAQAKKIVEAPQDFVAVKRGIVSGFLAKNPNVISSNGNETSSPAFFNPFPPQANGAVKTGVHVALAVTVALLAIYF